MEEKSFEILEAGKTVKIDGHEYKPVPKAEVSGIMQCAETGQTVLVKRFPPLAKDELKETRDNILYRYYKSVGQTVTREMIKEKDGEYQKAAREDFHKEGVDFRFIVPDRYTVVQQQDGRFTVYTYSMLPEKFTERYHIISRVVRAKLPVHVRVKASMWLAIQLWYMKKLFDDELHGILPEDIFVNIQTGEVQIVLGPCFTQSKQTPPIASDAPSFYYMRCGGKDNLSEKELVRFAAYSCFRLLLGSDPFDGYRSLINLPLLTEHVLWKLHRGCDLGIGTTNYFICAEDPENEGKKWISKGVRAHYEKLPGFIKKSFAEILGKPLEEQAEITLDHWLIAVYRLCDCMIYDEEKKQFFFCDPATETELRFLECVGNSFMIPIVPKKGIFWYHINGQYYDPDKGIKDGCVGGILKKDNRYYIVNKTHMRWEIRNAFGQTGKLEPEKCRELTLSMEITIGNVVYRVTSAIPDGAQLHQANAPVDCGPPDTGADTEDAPAEDSTAENTTAENVPAENTAAENTAAENAPAENTAAAAEEAVSEDNT